MHVQWSCTAYSGRYFILMIFMFYQYFIIYIGFFMRTLKQARQGRLVADWSGRKKRIALQQHGAGDLSTLILLVYVY